MRAKTSSLCSLNSLNSLKTSTATRVSANNACRLRLVAGIACGVLLALGMPGGARAQTVGDPVVFNYTGASQTYTVGADITSLDVELWGAGGAGRSGGAGGGGGYAGGSLAVMPGEILTLIVGGGGTYNFQTALAQGGYGGGGSGLVSGGGRSAIDAMSVTGSLSELVTAGAGGAGTVTGFGGAGGGEVGADGVSSFGGVGLGGTQTAGGATGAGPRSSGGSAFRGGSVFPAGGAGGGSGYYGGGSGTTSGGGGSSYVANSALNGTGTTVSGSGAVPGNRIAVDYTTYGAPSGVGGGYDGTVANSASAGGGGNGLIVVRPVSAAGGARTPEPGSLALGALGSLCGLPLLAGLARRRKLA